jgi:hypothetical protein
MTLRSVAETIVRVDLTGQWRGHRDRVAAAVGQQTNRHDML